MSRKNLILGLLVIFLTSYIYIFEIREPRNKATEQDFLKKVVHLEKDKIQKIHLKNIYNDFVFERKEKLWYVTAPLRDVADARAIDEMLNFFKNENWFQEIPIQGAQDLQKYGIGMNRATWIEVEDANGTKNKVLISNSKTIEGGIYLYWEEESGKKLQQKVYTASKTWSDFFEKNILYYRDKTVLREDLSYIQKVEITPFAQETFSFYEGKEDWRFQSGGAKEFRIDNRKVYDWIQDLVDWSCVDFLNKTDFYASRRASLGIPDAGRWIKVRVSDLANKKHLKFMVSPIVNHKAYVDVEGREDILEVFENTIDFLKWKLIDFQNPKKPFHLEFSEVQKIVWNKEGQNHFLTAEKPALWSQFWRMFVSLKAESYKEQAEENAEPMDLRFYDASNQELWALLAYKIDKDFVYLKIVKGKESFFVELLKKDWDNFYKVIESTLQR